MLNSVPKLWKFTILHRIINKSIIHSLVVSVHSLRENLEPLQMFSPSNKYKYFIHKFAMLNAYKLLWCLQLRMKMYSMSVFRITYLLRAFLHQYRQAVIRAHHYRNQRHAKTENNDKSRKPTQTNKEIEKKTAPISMPMHAKSIIDWMCDGKLLPWLERPKHAVPIDKRHRATGQTTAHAPHFITCVWMLLPFWYCSQSPMW